MLDFCSTVNMSIRNAQSTQSAIYFIYENAIVSCRPTSYASYIHGSLCLALCCIVFFCVGYECQSMWHIKCERNQYMSVYAHIRWCAHQNNTRTYSDYFQTYLKHTRTFRLAPYRKYVGFRFSFLCACYFITNYLYGMQ